MKNLLIIFGLVFSLSLSSKSQTFIKSETVNSLSNITLNKTLTSNRVYICGGNYAKKFHSRNNCRGLNNCRSKIYYYDSQQEAIDNGYKYCLICWK